MIHYNNLAEEQAAEIAKSHLAELIGPVLASSRSDLAMFPEPKSIWLDATYDAAAQFDAYSYVAPMRGKTVLQLGGTGLHAVKFLLAGARQAWLCSPMIGELKSGSALARFSGVKDGLNCVVGVAEELPFESEFFDVVYAGGCLHHTVMDLALAEIARVLKPGGRLGAMDPWRAPFYAIGKKMFGKRPEWVRRGVRDCFECAVQCRPLTAERVRALYENFGDARVIHHGSFTRYPLVALSTRRVEISLKTAWVINLLDDAVASKLPGARSIGSSVALLATK